MKKHNAHVEMARMKRVSAWAVQLASAMPKLNDDTHQVLVIARNGTQCIFLCEMELNAFLFQRWSSGLRSCPNQTQGHSLAKTKGARKADTEADLV